MPFDYEEFVAKPLKAGEITNYPVLLTYEAWLELGGEPLGHEYRWGVGLFGDKRWPLGEPEEDLNSPAALVNCTSQPERNRDVTDSISGRSGDFRRDVG